ncbi:MAG: cytochrome c oxidase subunit II [Gammaproteobacteria bacterium]|nr:cytochrome c oxidase subunit II [Gammaproteobacteria bacterium]NNM21042.1 cytochrome c oxidase subunit II [Gammaproteobacteria bacterium]
MRERIRQYSRSAVFGLLSFFLLLPAALADWELNLMPGVTPISRDTYQLHMLIFWVCVAIAVVVFGVMFYSLYMFRRSRGAQPDTTMVHSTKMEIIWTIIPIVILVAMAIPAAESLIKIEDTRAPDITIKVTGYQWKWHYEYLGRPDDPFVQSNFGFFSNIDAVSNAARQVGSGVDVYQIENYLRDVDRRVIVPVNKKVRILLTSNDVLHAWWVPELGGKRDAIPGFVNEMWFQAEETGVYRGQCAELCGRDHGFMPIVVEVQPEDEFAAWVAANGGAAGGGVADVPGGSQAATASAGGAAGGAGSSAAVDMDMSMDELMSRGESAYLTNCSACHQPNGQGLEVGGFPALAGSAIATGPVDGHIGQLLNGVPGTAMASFAYLSDADIAAIITYERNAWGNDTGDIVQPADVKAAR